MKYRLWKSLVTTTPNMSYHDMAKAKANSTSFDREYLHWSFIILEVAAVVVIVIGDISMLMMFFTRKLLGQSTNILVFSVAIGDLVTGLMAIPLAMMQKILVEPSEFLCKGYFYFSNVSKTAVGYTILLLAMERIIALLIHTFRILPPGRCLFFASLTWFFAAAYNIWSVVIYDVAFVTLTSNRRTKDLFLCFASSRFMYIHDIFEILNPLVTFTFPALCSSLLFMYFLRNKHEADKPGRPYKSSKSVVIFTFALLVSFVASHLPWEIATLVLNYDAPEHHTRQLVSLKVLHLLSFSRGFWDIFIFGAFRHYVCKKEKALAHFREQRSLHVQRSNLTIPINDRQISTSLLDSDPSVSRRYSSDISRRPSAFDDGPSVQIDHTNGHLDPEEEPLQGPINPHVPEETVVTRFVQVGYLVPRSPCADSGRHFFFPPVNETKFFTDLERRQTLPGKSRFGSCEAIQESTEDGDSLSALASPARKFHNLRRKSCGDRIISHPRSLHLHSRAAKHLPSINDDTCSDDKSPVLPHTGPVSPHTGSVVDASPLKEKKDMSPSSPTASKNESPLDTKGAAKRPTSLSTCRSHNSSAMSASKSENRLALPSVSDAKNEYNHETRRNTLTVPSAVPRRGSSTTCNFLTVPSRFTPYIPRSPCASD